MKREEKMTYLFIWVLVLVWTILHCIETHLDNTMRKYESVDIEISGTQCQGDVDKYFPEEFKVVGTVYNPTSNQCDSDPLITADNSKICLEKLKRGELKWIAISRDLRKDFPYGTEVEIWCESDPSINGTYLVKDTMNPRWKMRIDFLHYSKRAGKWSDIVMTRKVL